MKILSFIILLFFILNNTAFSKELKIECTVKKIDEKGNFYKVGDKLVWTYDLSSKKYIVTDDFISHYNLVKVKDKYFLQFFQIFRYTGQFIQKTAEIPEDQLEDFQSIDYENQNSETFQKVFSKVNNFFFENKLSKQNVYWQENIMDCVKAEKRF